MVQKFCYEVTKVTQFKPKVKVQTGSKAVNVKKKPF
jgi:hypothetical protein